MVERARIFASATRRSATPAAAGREPLIATSRSSERSAREPDGRHAAATSGSIQS